MDLDLKTQPNKELVKMITDDEGEEIEDEVESQLFLLAKKLKRQRVTKQTTVSVKFVAPNARYYFYADVGQQSLEQLVIKLDEVLERKSVEVSILT